ncbi:MAG: hypothetical protein CVU04_00855 [Bacteroidetes bacterium HGW-Bacteroidetes-20]|nr:MAG: hypothetical protein CVU04_00855 [Bacteroidetes bacterium HGW-Bacteroidetes-20]
MYWDISFIYKKSDNNSKEIISFLSKEYSLNIGENENTFWGKRKIVVFRTELFDEIETDFDEICVSISNQVFHKDTFDNELMIFTNFINHCFEYNQDIQYVVCSYELNGYLLSKFKRLNDFENIKLINFFPVMYKRDNSNKILTLFLNFKAQDMFTS